VLIYHSSKYEHEVLQPAFKHTGVEVQWDQTESNHYLYAAKSRDDVIDMGLASALEQSFKVNRVQTRDQNITIVIENGAVSPTREDLLGIVVYLYTIFKAPEDGWEAVNNRFNNLADEFKTKNDIQRNIRKVEKIEMKEWLRHRKVTVLNSAGKPAWSGW